MMFWWMVFGEVIGKICLSRCPKYDEMTLFHTITYPVETHVNGA
jgi:hypothetical protein